MYIYVARDWDGNVFISDDRDCLPPSVTDFHEVFLPERNRHENSEDPTLNIDIKDYSEIISL